jgi:hypothetical protein
MQKKAFALILLVCLVASPFMLKLTAAKAQTTSLTQTGLQLDYSALGLNFYQIVGDGNTLYFYCSNVTDNRVVILKVDATSFAVTGNYSADFDGQGDGGLNMIVLNGYLYYAQEFFNATADGQQRILMKIDTSSMTFSGNFTTATPFDSISSYCEYGGILYVGLQTWDGNNAHSYVCKVNPATMLVTFTSADFTNPMSVLQPVGTLLFGYCSDSNVYEFDPSTLLASTTLPYSDYGPTFSNTANFVESFENVAKYSLTDFSQVGDWDESSIGQTGDSVGVTLCNNTLVAYLTPDSPPVSLVVIDSATMTTLATASSPTGYGSPGGGIWASGNYVYVNYNSVTKIVQYSLSGSGVAPTPTPSSSPAHHGGNGGDTNPFVNPTHSPPGWSPSLPKSVTGFKLSSMELLGIAVFGSVATIASLMYLSSRKSKKQ